MLRTEARIEAAHAVEAWLRKYDEYQQAGRLPLVDALFAIYERESASNE